MAAETLQLLHPTCYDDLICAIKELEDVPDRENMTDDENDDGGGSQTSATSPTALNQMVESSNNLLPVSSSVSSGLEGSDTNSENQSSRRRKPTLSQLNKINKSINAKNKFAGKSYVLSLLAHLLTRMDKQVFLNPHNKISSHFNELIGIWFSKIGQPVISSMEVLAKRDMVIIFKRCISFSGSLDLVLKHCPIQVEESSFTVKALFVFGFFVRLLEMHPSCLTQENSNVSKDIVALETAVIDTTTLILSLQMIEQESTAKVEDYLKVLFLRGANVQEFLDIATSTYLSMNKAQFSKVLQLAISSCPSVSEMPDSIHEYVSCVALCRSVITLLEQDLLSYSKFMVKIYLLSLLLQCSFEIVVRSLGVSLANVIAGRKYKDKLNEERIKELENESTGKSKLEEIGYIDPDSFLPCLSHIDREVYVGIALRYSASVADKYKIFTNDVLSQTVEINKILDGPSDVALMLRLVSPWARNFGTLFMQPPRWIIRGVFYLVLSNFGDPTLSLAINDLWKELIAADAKRVLPLALEWVLDHCSNEIGQKQVDVMVVKMCSCACLAFARHGEAESQIVIDFLIKKLRTYNQKEAPLEPSKFYQWYVTVRQDPDAKGILQEKAAFLMLINIAIAQNTTSFGHKLPNILQYSFVGADCSSWLEGIPYGEDFVTNLLQGMQSHLKDKQQKLDDQSRFERWQQISNLREHYFPDTTALMTTMSILSYYIPPAVQKSRQTDHTRSPSSSERGIECDGDALNTFDLGVKIQLESKKEKKKSSAKRRRTLENIQEESQSPKMEQPLSQSQQLESKALQETLSLERMNHIPAMRVNRLVDFLETEYPGLRQQWTNISLKWTLYAVDINTGINSFALFSALVESISYDQILRLILAIISSAREGNLNKFKLFSRQLYLLTKDVTLSLFFFLFFF